MPMTRMILGAARVGGAAAVVALSAGVALAHGGAGHGGGLEGGFLSGFTHPILGWDHVAAMVAVGLWGAFLGRPAIWILPIVFPMVMAVGAALGILGVGLPQVETGIALSAVVLGLMILLAARPPLLVSALLVGAFAIFHGHAHGTELPATANAAAYAVGFVISTGLLHLGGIALGVLTRWRTGRVLVRGAGAAISVAGVAFLTGAV
ncbi:MAG: HupE/UreJ family protein [Pseudomonadota bacterium]